MRDARESNAPHSIDSGGACDARRVYVCVHITCAAILVCGYDAHACVPPVCTRYDTYAARRVVHNGGGGGGHFGLVAQAHSVAPAETVSRRCSRTCAGCDADRRLEVRLRSRVQQRAAYARVERGQEDGIMVVGGGGGVGHCNGRFDGDSLAVKPLQDACNGPPLS